MTQPKPPASEVLTALAMEVAEQDRWCHGETKETDEQGCLLWHLSKLVGIGFARNSLNYSALCDLPEIRYLAVATCEPRGCRSRHEMVYNFNDQHTQAECVDLAHRAAVLAKEAESRGEAVRP